MMIWCVCFIGHRGNVEARDATDNFIEKLAGNLLIGNGSFRMFVIPDEKVTVLRLRYRQEDIYLKTYNSWIDAHLEWCEYHNAEASRSLVRRAEAAGIPHR